MFVQQRDITFQATMRRRKHLQLSASSDFWYYFSGIFGKLPSLFHLLNQLSDQFKQSAIHVDLWNN